jgi:hypothetical protein
MTASEKDLPVIHIQILHVFFQLNYYYWPWDTQSCELIVGSWTKSGWEVDVVNMNGGKKFIYKIYFKNILKSFKKISGNVTNLHLSNYASNLWTIVEARARREVTYYHGIGEKLLLVLTDSALSSQIVVFE